jgi:hypothetical protein
MSPNPSVDSATKLKYSIRGMSGTVGSPQWAAAASGGETVKAPGDTKAIRAYAMPHVTPRSKYAHAAPTMVSAVTSSSWDTANKTTSVTKARKMVMKENPATWSRDEALRVRTQ